MVVQTRTCAYIRCMIRVYDSCLKYIKTKSKQGFEQKTRCILHGKYYLFATSVHNVMVLILVSVQYIFKFQTPMRLATWWLVSDIWRLPLLHLLPCCYLPTCGPAPHLDLPDIQHLQLQVVCVTPRSHSHRPAVIADGCLLGRTTAHYK